MTSLVIISGGFDPLHSGHIAMFKASSMIGDIVVCLNSDEWLTRKKGKPFMTFGDRTSVVGNMKGVVDVIKFKDDDNTVCDGIYKVYERYRYQYSKIFFVNGGDRDRDSIPKKERAVCDGLGIFVKWGIGGSNKIQSSSLILKSWEIKFENTGDKVKRQWGEYFILESAPRYKIKHITIVPGHKTSIQAHFNRAEHWVIVKGTARVLCGNKVRILSGNENTYIPIGEKHCLENPGQIPVEIIEVQRGDYLEEDDIVRYENPDS